MEKKNILLRIEECGVVAVVRANGIEQAQKIAAACIEAEIAAIEITYTIPGASDVIRSLSDTYSDGRILIGAGTVLDPETARSAILAGANFIVSPCLNRKVAALCNRYQIPYMPGAMTVLEVVTAMEAGADIIRIFPGELFGPAIIKAFKGPLPQAVMMPTGGVTLDNVKDWIQAGAVAVGVGGSLTAGAKTGNYKEITDLGRQFVARVRDARLSLKK